MLIIFCEKRATEPPQPGSVAHQRLGRDDKKASSYPVHFHIRRHFFLMRRGQSSVKTRWKCTTYPDVAGSMSDLRYR